jgi:hypothetical protein
MRIDEIESVLPNIVKIFYAYALFNTFKMLLIFCGCDVKEEGNKTEDILFTIFILLFVIFVIFVIFIAILTFAVFV